MPFNGPLIQCENTLRALAQIDLMRTKIPCLANCMKCFDHPM